MRAWRTAALVFALALFVAALRPGLGAPGAPDWQRGATGIMVGTGSPV